MTDQALVIAGYWLTSPSSETYREDPIRIERTAFDGSEEDQIWAVRQLGECLDRDGKWIFETGNSNRDEEWRKQHRFTLLDAIEIARRVGGRFQRRPKAPEASDEPDECTQEGVGGTHEFANGSCAFCDTPDPDY